VAIELVSKEVTPDDALIGIGSLGHDAVHGLRRPQSEHARRAHSRRHLRQGSPLAADADIAIVPRSAPRSSWIDAHEERHRAEK